MQGIYSIKDSTMQGFLTYLQKILLRNSTMQGDTMQGPPVLQMEYFFVDPGIAKLW